MRQHRTHLKRLQRELERQRRAKAERPLIQQIEVYSDGELVEVMPLPYRVYELDDAGRRVLVAKNEGDLALEEYARRLVHGR